MKPLIITQKITNRDADSFNRYLQEVDKIPQLTVDEEYEVAMAAWNGDEDAKQKLITANLRFVISVAKQYATSDIKVEDLVNEGNIGLITAADRFDPTKGFKFISYAVWWIRRLVLEHITKKSRTIRLPSHKIGAVTKLHDRVNEVEQTIQRKATLQDLIDHLGDEFSTEDLRFFLTMNETATMSLDSPVGEEADSSKLSDVISGNEKPTDHMVMSDDAQANVQTMLKLLPKHVHRVVLTRLYGLDGGDEMTLKEVADEIGLTRERVRQIRNQALRILRGKSRRDDVSYMFR